MREYHKAPKYIRPMSLASYEIQEIRRKVDPEVNQTSPARGLIIAVAAVVFVLVLVVLLSVGVFNVG